MTQPRVTSLDAAAQRLGEIARSPVREYSTFDFGRERDDRARSVVVPQDRSKQVVRTIRRQLGPDLIAFVGTTQWLGDEQHPDAEEVVVAAGKSQMDILRVARSDAANYGMDTEDLVKRLRQYDERYGIDIFHAETDTIEFSFRQVPDDLNSFGEELYEFCPDIVDQGTLTVPRLVEEIQRTGQVFLWWD